MTNFCWKPAVMWEALSLNSRVLFSTTETLRILEKRFSSLRGTLPTFPVSPQLLPVRARRINTQQEPFLEKRTKKEQLSQKSDWGSFPNNSVPAAQQESRSKRTVAAVMFDLLHTGGQGLHQCQVLHRYQWLAAEWGSAPGRTTDPNLMTRWWRMDHSSF